MSGAFYRPAERKTPRDRGSGGPLRTALTALAALTIGAAAVASGALALRAHPRFRVIRVVLSGVPEAHRADVEKLTDGWIGRPLLYADLDGPMRELSTRSWVVRAAARRLVPDTIEVRVTANPPVALARCDAGLCTVDRDGNVLASWAGRGVSKGDDFVLLDADLDAGTGPEERAAALARGAAVLERLRREDPALVSRLSEIEIRPDTFALVDRVARVRLLYGSDAAEPGRVAPLWRVFLALRPELIRHALDVREADLRFADQIVLKKPGDDVPGKT